MFRQEFWLNAWYQGRWWLLPLWPLSLLFRLLAKRRRQRLTRQQQPLPVPVVVVGNISVGGTGKTPLLIALVQHLQRRGWRPGVISRGYGGVAPHYPFAVGAASSPAQVGDEPLLIARQAGCPVMVGPDRPLVAQQLLDNFDCDIILSDDGLQHYRLARSLEIAVVDGQRGLGNGHCLPMGPLREQPQRLQEVDLVVVNGSSESQFSDVLDNLDLTCCHRMTLTPDSWGAVTAQTGEQASDSVTEQTSPRLPIDQFPAGRQVHAVAGIGNPTRFYQTLADLGFDCQPHDFADHHAYGLDDFAFTTESGCEPSMAKPIVMTAKDAVKCFDLGLHNAWYLSVTAQLGQAFWDALDQQLARPHEPTRCKPAQM